jgi:hypothetical protein
MVVVISTMNPAYEAVPLNANVKQLYLAAIKEMEQERTTLLPPKPKSKWKAFFRFFKLF